MCVSLLAGQLVHRNSRRQFAAEPEPESRVGGSSRSSATKREIDERRSLSPGSTQTVLSNASSMRAEYTSAALVLTLMPTLRASAISLYGAFFVKKFARAENLLSFVSFFVRSQSPFLRPDPRFADVVARRSCQGWPPRQPCGMLRACQAIP